MATLDEINHGIIVAGQTGDVESAKALLAARDELTSGPQAAPDAQPDTLTITAPRVSAAPNNDLWSQVKQFAADTAGNTRNIWHQNHVALDDRLAQQNPLSIGGLLQQSNPVNNVQNLGNVIGMGLSPAGGLVEAIGSRIDPVYGKPGSKGDELNKWGDLGENLASAGLPIAGEASGAGRLASALMKDPEPAINVTRALSLARSVPSKIGSVLDAGSTATAQSVRSAALAKVMAQQQALADAQAAVQAGKATDAQLRPAMEAAAAKQADQGIGVSDIPEAQQLVADLQARLKPNSPVATVPNPDQAKAYQQVIDVLAPKAGPKPDLATVQNLRRELATAYNGDQTGYAALAKGTRKDLVAALNGVENAYTGGLQAPVQENYTALMAAQGQAKQLGKIAPDLTQAAAKLDALPPQDSVRTAQSIVDKLQKRGLVSDSEYQDFVNLAQNAKDAAGKAAFRKKVLMVGAGAVGAGTLGGHAILHALGVP